MGENNLAIIFGVGAGLGGAISKRFAERHLTPDESGRPITHPLIDSLFSGFENGSYKRHIAAN